MDPLPFEEFVSFWEVGFNLDAIHDEEKAAEIEKSSCCCQNLYCQSNASGTRPRRNFAGTCVCVPIAAVSERVMTNVGVARIGESRMDAREG